MASFPFGVWAKFGLEWKPELETQRINATLRNVEVQRIELYFFQ